MWTPPWTQSVGLFGSRGTELPQAVEDAFVAMGEDQRGYPEGAMLRVQSTIGGSELSLLVEHAGDLTNRMTAAIPRESAGYGYVLEKVDMLLRRINNYRRPFGPVWAEALREDIDKQRARNAAGRGISDDKSFAAVKAALDRYVEEHSKLPVYNEAQWTARAVAIRIGRQDFSGASRMLQKLKDHLGSVPEWVAYAHQYTLNPDGTPKPYTPPSRY